MAKIAVVGAGIGGCAFSYFAKKYLPNTEVTIYEAQNRIGGRVLTQHYAGSDFELGAAFFNDTNKLIVDLVKAEQLKAKRLEERGNFAVWNGSKLIFKSSKQSAVTDVRLLEKYQLSLARTFLLIREAKRQFAKLYREAQKTPSEIGHLLEAAGLDKWYTRGFDDVLLEAGVGQGFLDEVVTPITRIIYTQNGDIGGLAGIASLIGVYSNATYSLVEGNSYLPTHLAEVSNAKVKLGQKVDSIEKTPGASYNVRSGEDVAQFDCVVIATPLEIAGIKFDGVQLPNWAPQPYQKVFRRTARGILNPAYFGLENSATPPSIILTTKNSGQIAQFSLQKSDSTESFVTISSPEPIVDDVFRGVFKGNSEIVLDHHWSAAYPAFKPIAKLPPTELDRNLLYLNSIEPSVSSMETAAFSALNAVRLMKGEVK